MATALSNAPAIKWCGSATGSTYRTVTRAEAASQTFKIGALLTYDTSADGVIEAATTSGNLDALGIYGIALSNATGTTGSPIDILRPNVNDEFTAILCSAEDTAVAPDDEDIGIHYELGKMDSSNNSVFAVRNETTAPMVKVVEVNPQDIAVRGGSPADPTTPTMSAGDKVVFSFLASVLDTTGAV